MDENPNNESSELTPEERELERLDFFVVFSSNFEINIYSSKNLQRLYQSSSLASSSIDIHQNPN
jgi:hypothetical protein